MTVYRYMENEQRKATLDHGLPVHLEEQTMVWLAQTTFWHYVLIEIVSKYGYKPENMIKEAG